MLKKITFLFILAVSFYTNAQNNIINKAYSINDNSLTHAIVYQGNNFTSTLTGLDNYTLDKTTSNSEKLTYNLNTALANKSRRHPMEKVGRILTYVGVPLAIIGGIMTANADEHYYECVNGDCTGDASGAFGAVFLGAGLGLSGTGGVLWILGSKK